MVAVTFPGRITYQFTLHGPSAPEEIAEMTLWTNWDALTEPSDWDAALLDLATQAEAGWHTNMDTASFRGSVTLDSVKAAQLNTSLHTEHEQVFVPGTPWAGDNTSASLPWQDSWCLSLYSYTPGTFIPNARNRRGRVYLPPFASSRLDVANKGTLADATVLDLLGQAKLWINSLMGIALDTMPASTSVSLGVLSRVVNKAPLTIPNIWELTDLAADGVIDTQRRRTRQETRVRQSLGL